MMMHDRRFLPGSLWRWGLAATAVATLCGLGSTAFASTGGTSGSSDTTWTVQVQVVQNINSDTPVSVVSGATGLSQIGAATTSGSSETVQFPHALALEISVPSTASLFTYNVSGSDTLVTSTQLSADTFTISPDYAGTTLGNAGYFGYTNGNALDYESDREFTAQAMTNSATPVSLTMEQQPFLVSTYSLKIAGPAAAGTYSGTVTLQAALSGVS